MPCPSCSLPTPASVTEPAPRSATAHQQQDAAARAELEAAHRGEHERAQLLIRAEEARAQAEVAVQVRDDDLSAASHDLRTTLTSIMARAELLLGRLDHDEALAPEFARLHLTALLQAAQRMRATVGEITEAAHLQMGQTLALDLALVDVGEMVQPIVQDVVQANAAREVSPVVVHVAANVLVHGHGPRLERVVQNIVENALRYSQVAAPVYVEVRQQDHWAVLTVRDQGVGIPADELAHIFTGLARSRTIVAQHGGQISLQSAVGRGTIVTVCLPCAVAEADHTSTPSLRCVSLTHAVTPLVGKPLGFL